MEGDQPGQAIYPQEEQDNEKSRVYYSSGGPQTPVRGLHIAEDPGIKDQAFHDGKSQGCQCQE
jgi:hypothetical protein